MKVRSESELLWTQFKKVFVLVITLPFHLIEILVHPHKLPEKFKGIMEWFKEFHRWIMETKVTAWLVIINVLIFPTSIALFSEDLARYFALVPSQLFSGNVFSLISSGFLHASIWHLVGNMTVLIIMGRVVEKELGSKNMLLIYFGSLILSGLSSSFVNYYLLGSDVPGIGASGAIAGLVSVAILLRPFYFTYLLFGIPVPIMLVGWLFIVQDALAVYSPVEGDNVGHIAHISGYLGVTLLIWLLSRDRRKKMFAGLVANVVMILLTVMVYVFWLRGAIGSFA